MLITSCANVMLNPCSAESPVTSPVTAPRPVALDSKPVDTVVNRVATAALPVATVDNSVVDRPATREFLPTSFGTEADAQF